MESTLTSIRGAEDASGGLSGGASRDRTDDLFHAMEALSQLSYGPTRSRGKLRTHLDIVKPDRTLR